MAVRRSVFVFTVGNSSVAIFNFYFLPFAFEFRVCFSPLQFFLSLFYFMSGLLPFFWLYMYRVPTQSEHILDPHFKFTSPGFEPCHIIAFFFFFFSSAFFPPVCVRVSTCFFLFPCNFMLLCFCSCLCCFPFYCSVCTGYRSISETIVLCMHVLLHWVLVAVCVLPCWCCRCCSMLLLNLNAHRRVVRCAALLLLAAVTLLCACCMIRTGYRPKVRARYYYLCILH